MTERTRAGIAGIVALACLLLGASDLFADEKTFDWTTPTTRVDGSPLDGVDAFTLKCGTADGGPYEPVETVDGETNTHTREFGHGTHYCVVTATADELESDPSNQVFFTIASPPAPPTLTVTDAG